MDVRPQPLLAGATAPSPLNCLFLLLLNLFLVLANPKTFQIAHILPQHHVLQKNKVHCFPSWFIWGVAQKLHKWVRQCRDMGVWSLLWATSATKKSHFQVLPPFFHVEKSNRMSKRCNWVVLCWMSRDVTMTTSKKWKLRLERKSQGFSGSQQNLGVFGVGGAGTPTVPQHKQHFSFQILSFFF